MVAVRYDGGVVDPMGAIRSVAARAPAVIRGEPVRVSFEVAAVGRVGDGRKITPGLQAVVAGFVRWRVKPPVVVKV